MKTVTRLRRQQVCAQRGLCFYCCQPMWEGCPERFAHRYGLKLSRVQCLKATTEHLLARCEGRADQPGNIVAACWFCNSRRHRTSRPLPPHDYAEEVQRRLATGKWQGLRLLGGDPVKGAPLRG